MRCLALLFAVVLLAGCGTGDDSAQVRAVTERFFAAVDHDGSAACGQLSQATVKQLEDQEGKPCEQAIGDQHLQGAAIVGVEVYITSAKVDLASHQSAFLDRGPSGWKLSAVGCAHGAKPADHPFNCEVED
jgi:uncharacterized lipoprotein NlpE involved in copper resistance